MANRLPDVYWNSLGEHGAFLQTLFVTLCVTLHWNSDPHFSMTQTHSKTPTAYPFYPQTLILFSELHMPDPT